MRAIKHIVIHCSASKNGDASVNRDVIDRWHREKGWNGIGYHHVIEVDGFVSTGRLESEIGAHVAGENASSIGICMVGTDKFSLAQWESLRGLCMMLEARYPTASFWGHRDFSPDKDGDGVIEMEEWFKTCPGFDVSEWRLSGMDPQWNLEHLLMPAANNQAGFSLVQMAAAVAALGMLTALFFGAKSMLDNARKEGYDAGHKAAMLTVAQRDNKQLADVQAELVQLQAAKDAMEKEHAEKVAQLDKEGTNAVRKVEKERDAARRDAARYAGRLRDPGRTTDAGCPGGGGSAPPTVVAGAGVDHGEAGKAGAELSEQAGAFLRGEASRADEVVFAHNIMVEQLGACQAVLVADRAL